jgi:hypothetical protein
MDIKESALTLKMESMLKEIQVEKEKHLENVKRARQIRITAANFIGVNWVTDLLIQGAKAPLQQQVLKINLGFIFIAGFKSIKNS